MKRSIPSALLAVGIALLVWGKKSLDSRDSDLSRTVTGLPTDRSIWLTIGGIASTVVGLAGILMSRRAA